MGGAPPQDLEARLAAIRPGEASPDVLELSREAEIEAACARLGLPPRRPIQEHYDELRHQLQHTRTLVRHVPRSLPARGLDLYYDFDRDGASIGEGAFADVYVASQKGTGRYVAIKLLNDKSVARMERHPLYKERFRREAWALEKAEDAGVPGIIRLVEFGDEGGRPYLIASFHDGDSLRVLLSENDLERGLPLAAAIRWGLDLFSSLARLHAIGIVHRDIKPNNLLLEVYPDPDLLAGPATHAEGTRELPGLVLADAGSVLMIGEERLSQWGVAPFTPEYAPPEALPRIKRDSESTAPEEALDIPQEIGPHTDVYSAACTLLEMLVGTEDMKHFRWIFDGSIQPREDDLARLEPFLSLAPLFAACLNPVPALRESDAGLIALRLSEFLDDLAGGR